MSLLRYSIYLIAAFIIFFTARFAFALTTISLSIPPTTLEESAEFEADVNFSCPSCGGDSYIRGVFYESGTKYFGFTQDNGGNWSNASSVNCTTFYKITKSDLDENGNWSKKLKFKVDKEDPYYNGQGTYFFKIGRYTPSCGSPLWSSEVSVIVSGPSPTRSPLPTSTPTTEPSPTKIPIPTRTPTPTKTPTPTATPKTQTPTKISTPIPTLKVSASIKTLTSTHASVSLDKTKTTEPTPKITTRLIPSPILGISTKSATKGLLRLKSKPKTQVAGSTDNKIPLLISSIAIAVVLIAGGIIYAIKIKERNLSS